MMLSKAVLFPRCLIEGDPRLWQAGYMARFTNYRVYRASDMKRTIHHALKSWPCHVDSMMIGKGRGRLRTQLEYECQ